MNTVQESSSERLFFCRKRALATLLLLSAFTYVPTASGFSFNLLEAERTGNIVEVTIETLLSLPDEVIDALNSTIDIVIVLEVLIYESRRFVPDPRVVDSAVAFTIAKSSSGRGYSVKTSDGAVDQHNFSIADALREVGRKRKFTIVLRGEDTADAGIEYYGESRIFLDRSRLPSLLRTTVYFKKSWNLDSGWTAFEL